MAMCGEASFKFMAERESFWNEMCEKKNKNSNKIPQNRNRSNVSVSKRDGKGKSVHAVNFLLLERLKQKIAKFYT